MRSILFLSAEDFKEKSIQVIRKTPEAYVKHNFLVTYIVARDNTNKGNYFYENLINPDGVRIIRFNQPLQSLINKINNPLLLSLFIKIRRYLTLFKLSYLGFKFLKNNKVDVIYGYEQIGFLAVCILRFFKCLSNIKTVSRFQGVLYVKEWLIHNNKLRRLYNFDTYYALKTYSHLCIITNDGSQGDQVLKKLNSKHLTNFEFLVNGVDEINIENSEINDLINSLPELKNKKVFLSVSRLDDHKRLDRCIRVIDILVNKFKISNIVYVIVGDGRLKNDFISLSESLHLNNHIFFVGAIPQNKVKNFYAISEFFLSMYESSNVGNPLLEAIRYNKIIATLNNGDTNLWIKHNINGLIFDVNDKDDLSQSQYLTIATSIQELLNDENRIKTIKNNLQITATEKLWTWESRVSYEINAVNKLLNKC